MIFRTYSLSKGRRLGPERVRPDRAGCILRQSCLTFLLTIEGAGLGVGLGERCEDYESHRPDKPMSTDLMWPVLVTAALTSLNGRASSLNRIALRLQNLAVSNAPER
jgi:hypothetical protein